MTLHFSHVLRPAQIDLHLQAASREEAVDLLLATLRGDERVPDFDALEHAIHERNAPAICQHGIGICIAHGRTNSLHSLVMAAARLENPVPLQDISGAGGFLHLVFVAGIPASLNTEYLRLVGAIARICSEEETRNAALAARTAPEFLEILESALNPV